MDQKLIVFRKAIDPPYEDVSYTEVSEPHSDLWNSRWDRFKDALMGFGIVLLIIGIPVGTVLMIQKSSVRICGILVQNQPIIGQSWMDDRCYLTIRTDSSTYCVEGTNNQMNARVGSSICVDTFNSNVQTVP